MTLKALATLNWIVKHCSNAKYFLKADDDAFVNEFAVLKHLQDIHLAGYRRRLLMCLIWRRAPVARQGKWAVSWAEFARRRYPTYCSGIGHVVTGDVIALLLAAAACHHIHHADVVDHLYRNPRTGEGVPDRDVDVTRNFVYRPNDSGIIDKGHNGDVSSESDGDASSDVIGNSSTYDVTYRRRYWIDDVYVTGLLVEALGGRIRHTNMSPAYCKSDKMAAVYRHVTEWYKYIFTQVGDDEADLYSDTWNALKQRAAETTIPSPSMIRPGRLADHYIPLSTMLQLANSYRRQRLERVDATANSNTILLPVFLSPCIISFTLIILFSK